MEGAVAVVVGAFVIGLGLAAAPGPVQAVLLAEAIRGGVARGFRALAGASGTFGTQLAVMALGVPLLPLDDLWLRLLRLGGGALLIWLSVEAFRADWAAPDAAGRRAGLPAPARGSLAVLLNPGAWLFLAAVAAPLLATASRSGGAAHALVASAALALGAALGDVVVVFAAKVLRRGSPRVGRWIRRALATALMIVGVVLVVSALA